MPCFGSRTDSLARASVVSFIATVVSLGACSGSVTTPGELIVEVTTDLSVPKDIDSIRVQIQSNGVTSFDQFYQVGAGQQELPATIGILAGSNPAATAVVRVVGIKGDTALILREATTTVPPNRVALLRMPLDYLCEGSAVDTAQTGTSPMPTMDPISESSCGQGQTCSEGACVSDSVSSASLPVYSPSQVFGGDASADASPDAGGGVCFNTTTCMAGSVPLLISLATCTAPLPSGVHAADVNIAIQTSDGQGICGGAAGTTPPCFVPIDEAATTGWQLVGGSSIELPPSICSALAGLKASLVISASCASKTPSTPTCGPWLTGDTPGKTLDGGVLKAGDAGRDAASDATTKNDSGADATLPQPTNELLSLSVGDGGTLDFDAFVPSKRVYAISTTIATLGQPVKIHYAAPDGSIVTAGDEAGAPTDGGDPTLFFPINHLNAQASTSFFLKVGPNGGGGDSGTYDFVVTPQQEAYAKASDTQAEAQFGTSVSLSEDGSTMAVGAAEWIPAGTTMTGSVYVFRRTAPATWGQPVEILPPSQQANEEFGEVVALAPDGNTLYVSAPGANNTIGSVYQYVAIGGVWPTTPTHTLNDPNSSSEGYGAALAMSRDGTTLVVGASLLTGGNGGAYVYATSSLTALPTTLATALINNSGSLGTAIAVSDDGTVVAVGGNNEGGAVCVFKKSGATWSPNPIGDPAGAGAMNTGFGLAVALSGDGTSLVVGAASVPSPELVYTYTLNSSGAPVSTSPPSISVPNLPASSPSGFGFGDSLALSDDGSVLVVGAPSDTTLASGINGSEDATAPSNPAAGAVYVYRASAGSWTQTAYIKPSNTFAQQNPDGLGFGQAFSLSGDGTTLAVGAIGESSNAVGVPLTLDAGPDGGESNTSESFAGAVYVFH